MKKLLLLVGMTIAMFSCKKYNFCENGTVVKIKEIIDSQQMTIIDSNGVSGTYYTITAETYTNDTIQFDWIDSYSLM